MSVHQQQQHQPVSFTRALEMSKSIGQSLNEPSEMQHRMQAASSGPDIKMQPVKGQQQQQQAVSQDGTRRDSVYDMNNYEISV